MIPNQEQNQTEEYDMPGTIGADTAGVLAILADNARAGGRGGVFGGEGGNGGFAPWAGPAANAARIEGVERTVNQQADCINGTLESLTRTLAMDAINKNIADGFGHACDKAEAVAVRNSDQIFALSRDIDNKFAVVTEQNHGIALGMKDQEIRNVERFCKLESGQATITAKLDHNKEVSELNAEMTALKTQIACGCVTGCSTPCNSGHGH